SLLSCWSWLKDLLATTASSWLPGLVCCFVCLCLAAPASGQPGQFVEGVPGMLDDLVALRNETSIFDNVPPRENAIFAPPPPSNEVRYLPDGNGWIVVSNPMEYPRLPALDCDDPGSLFYTYRANLFGIDVPDEWDFYNLINTDRPDFT